MIENEALVSIVMPAYNPEKYIDKAIDSVIAQTYRNWELIIVDDASTDSTAGVIKEYTKKDMRIKYHKLDENSGAAIARNTAVKLAKENTWPFLTVTTFGFQKNYLSKSPLWKLTTICLHVLVIQR